VFLRVFDAAIEEEEDRPKRLRPVQPMSWKAAQWMANARPFLEQKQRPESLRGECRQRKSLDEADTASTSKRRALRGGAAQTVKPVPKSLWTLRGIGPLEAAAEALERRGEKLDLRAFAEQERLENHKSPPDPAAPLDRYPQRNCNTTGQPSWPSSPTDVAAFKRALEQAAARQHQA